MKSERESGNLIMEQFSFRETPTSTILTIETPLTNFSEIIAAHQYSNSHYGFLLI